MNQKDQLAGEIMVMVSSAREQRLRPHEIQKALSTKFSVPLSMVKDVLKEIVARERLVFTYRDPCNYVEIPYTEVNTGVRPLKVIVDGDGEPWICDTAADPSQDLADQGCWRCGELRFTGNE